MNVKDLVRIDARMLSILIAALFAGTWSSASGGESHLAGILSTSGAEGGLVVCIGCEQYVLTKDLRDNEKFIVQFLESDPANVETARTRIQAAGRYGDITVREYDGDHLPYRDNMVNLLVANADCRLTPQETLRVLVPGGMALFDVAIAPRSFSNALQTTEQNAEFSLSRTNGWIKVVKGVPPEIDDWTHHLHDPGNNAVAHDQRVGPPRRMQWRCGPLWSRSHEYTSSMCAMVSAGGRLFYIFDEGQTGIENRCMPERWTLIARDAFNGKLLWKKRLDNWRVNADDWLSRALRNIPQTVQARLAATAKNVFVTIGPEAEVAALDTATGDIIRRYPETARTHSIRILDGVLLLWKDENSILALDADSGKRLWSMDPCEGKLRIAAGNDRVFIHKGDKLNCFDVANGRNEWEKTVGKKCERLIAHKDILLMIARGEGFAFSGSTGEQIWKMHTRSNYNEPFIAGGKAWTLHGNKFVGYDIQSGKQTAARDASDILTPGHHWRCYPSKATDNFIITPNRGAEFVDLNGGPNTQNDWLRGACVFGVLPCNGLLYIPPDPCLCYPGAKLRGLNALAPAAVSDALPPATGNRLLKGPAYDEIQNLVPEKSGVSGWSTFRGRPNRHGYANTALSTQPTRRWVADFEGDITQPVVSDDKAYVAVSDHHLIQALDAGSGKKLWSFTANGRIDSPPTIHKGLVLFGTASGYAYCLRASDGALAWRFRAAPSDRQIISMENLESPWPVRGSVLIVDDKAYFTAGRSSFLDGGIRLFALAPRTGEVLHRNRLHTWRRTREDAEGKPFIPAYHIEGARSDVLASQNGHIYLYQYKFDLQLNEVETPYVVRSDEKHAMRIPELKDKPYARKTWNAENIEKREKRADGWEKTMDNIERRQRNWQWNNHKKLMQSYQKRYGGANLGDRKTGLHLFSTSGFLDDAWYNRMFWMYSDTWPGFYIANLASKTGQLIAVDEDRTYAVKCYTRRNLQSPLFTPGRDGYLLIADNNDNEPRMPERTRGTPKGIGFTRQKPPVWFRWLKLRVRAMVAAQNALFVAGPPDIVKNDDPMAAFEGRAGASMLAISKQDGNTLFKHEFTNPPIFDGMAAANGRLYISFENGVLQCWE